MKISELISELTTMKERHGDLIVTFFAIEKYRSEDCIFYRDTDDPKWPIAVELILHDVQEIGFDPNIPEFITIFVANPPDSPDPQ